MSAGNARLFAAFEVPRDHLERVQAETAGWRDTLGTARWTAPENQHVTLRFLGATPAELVDAVKAACRDAALRVEPTEVALAGLGAFPSPRRARVLWLGLDDPRATSVALAAALDDALTPLGYEPEGRAYTPHLTLARLREPRRVDLPALDLGLPSFPLDSFALFRSHLSPKGARYERLETFRLRDVRHTLGI